MKLIPVKRYGMQAQFFDETVWANMLIFGDNVVALETLKDYPNIYEQVRLVYIDPPFATNHIYRAGMERTSHVSQSTNDQVAYIDTLTGKPYLEFLRERFIVLRELLSKDGSMYVHIDCNVGHYVKVLLDEVFGKEYFINDIARIKCNPKNFQRKAYGNVRDTILFYSKGKDYVWNHSFEKYSEDDIKRLFSKVEPSGRRYTTNPLHAPGETHNGPTGQPWRGCLPPRGRHWRYPPDKLEELDGQGLIEWSRTGNPRKKIYADEFVKKKMKRQDVWEFKDPAYPDYPTQKNLEMLKVIVQASSNPGDIVLDCFAGAGTTLLAAEQLGRRWIGIDNSSVAIAVTLKRLLKLKSQRPFGLYCTEDSLETVQEILKK